MLGTDVLPKLGCSVVLPQGDGKITDLLRGQVWDKSQCSSQSSRLRAEAPSFIPAVVRGMAAEVGHSNLKSGESSKSQLCAEVESIESNSELKSSELQLCAEVGSIETNSTLTSGNYSDVESIEMNSDHKSGESSESQLCAEVESIKTNVKPGEFRESQLCVIVKPEVKLLRATRLPARHAKVVQAQISAGAVSSGTHLFMLEPGKCQSGESDVIVSTSIVHPNSDEYFKVLIKNHGVCPVHLEAAHVVESLSSVTEVPSENLPGLWDRQFEPVSDDKVDVTLCNLQPRVESLLQFVSVDWQSLDEADAVQLQSLIKDYADVFKMDHLELGRTELVQHVVDTGSHTPIKQPPCWIPFSLRQKVETPCTGDVDPRSCE